MLNRASGLLRARLWQAMQLSGRTVARARGSAVSAGVAIIEEARPMSHPTTTPAARIRTDVDGPVGRLIIDNPARLNAVSLAMWQAIPAAVAELDNDPAVRVIVVAGAGDKAFVSGADISEFAEVRKDAASARAYEAANAGAFRAIRHASKPTIALIRGACLGGGLGIAIACDMRMAGSSAVFGIPAARLGVGYPPDCMGDLVAAIGPSRAKELFFTARRLSAGEAERIGLVARVVADSEIDAEVATLAATIAANAPLTIRAAKAAIDRLSGDPDGSGLVAAQALADACFESADFAEGRAAFLEKRLPDFTGR